MNHSTRLAGACLAAALSTTAQAQLAPRDLTGDGIADAVYDTVNHLTWLRDADRNGAASQPDQLAWAASFQVGAYADWRLPSSQEMLDLLVTHGYHDRLASTFDHLQYIYWSSDVVAFSQPLGIWVTTDFGNTFIAQAQWAASAMAVTAGDIGVPVAASVPEVESRLLAALGLTVLLVQGARQRRGAARRPVAGTAPSVSLR